MMIGDPAHIPLVHDVFSPSAGGHRLLAGARSSRDRRRTHGRAGRPRRSQPGRGPCRAHRPRGFGAPESGVGEGPRLAAVNVDSGNVTVGGCVRGHASSRGSDTAFATPDGRFTWASVRRRRRPGSGRADRGRRGSTRRPGGRPDARRCRRSTPSSSVPNGPASSWSASASAPENARSPTWSTKTGARLLVTARGRRDDLAAMVGIDGLVLPADLALLDPGDAGGAPAIGPDDLFLINSTSGTTGLPKCVMHTQARWFAFHRWAVEAGDLAATTSCCRRSRPRSDSGSGRLTSRPAILGCPTVHAPSDSTPACALDLIEESASPYSGCVSTQFIMMLNEQAVRPRDLSLAAVHVHRRRGRALRARAPSSKSGHGASVLQFYGSNETGALSPHDDRTTRRAPTAPHGRADDRRDARPAVRRRRCTTSPAAGVPAIPGAKGPATCLGYYDDDEANAELFTADGWMLMGDIVEIDDEGYLTVVGRTSDFIIRGGKNISAPAVEAEVGTHPGVAMVGGGGHARRRVRRTGVRLRRGPSPGGRV